ncbi:response regulator transcription factor [bacterium]|nr:response regulator transcription factor [bacterium]
MKQTKIKIYIVEDYMLTRATYKHFLSKKENINFLQDFECAEDCINSMNIEIADVILMDLGLPKMNGLEATKIIKERWPSTKIIILTSHEHEDEILASLATGANAYVLKDIEFETLYNVIQLVNDGAIWIDPKIAAVAMSAFPKPLSTNFENLYTKKEPYNNNLTKRELEVLELIVEGKTNTEIAEKIVISPNTAKAHVCNILQKLSVTDRVQAAVKAVKQNIL